MSPEEIEREIAAIGSPDKSGQPFDAGEVADEVRARTGKPGGKHRRTDADAVADGIMRRLYGRG